jgi:glycosyltransferase involved in cell wall biosynthesis
MNLKFKNPVNFRHFKIEYTGNDILEEHIQPYEFISKTNEETLNFLKNKTVAFLGLARNCENSLYNVVKNLKKIGSLFLNYEIYILENDSTDNTRKVISDISKHGKLTPVFLDKLDFIFPKRTARLAFCRNTLLNLTMEKKFDYIICFDSDGVFNEIDLFSFIKVFRNDSVWDAVFPSSNPYYDLWAFRHSSLLDCDFTKLIGRLPAIIGTDNNHKISADPISNFDFSKFAGWLSVESAFGGLGIYKSSMYFQSSYWGFDGDEEVCEHVNFHKKMLDLGAKLYIAPEFKLS